MAVTVDPEGLSSTAAGLGSVQEMNVGGMCAPPAGDPVSVWVATVFNASRLSVYALLSHAAAQRAAGAAALSSTAHTLQAADGANAAAITANQPSAVGAMMPAAVGDMPAPMLPPIPTLPPPPAPLTGEQLASLVHSGPGPEVLRDTATQLRATAGRVSVLADDTRRYGALVDANWQDGQQQAGANMAAHAEWLDGVHGHLSSLADSADQAAGHVGTLLQQTPRPEEFTAARRRVADAQAQFRASGGLNPVPVTTAMANFAGKQTQAVTANQAYYGAATATAAGLPPLPQPAPPIVKGDAAHKKQAGKAKTKLGSGPAEDTPDSHDGIVGGQPDTAGQDLAPGPITPAPDPAGRVPAALAQIAGTLVGAGTSTVGQLAGGLQGLASAPVSALSSLTSGLGGPGSFDPPPSLGADPGTGAVPDSGSPDVGGGGDSSGGPGATIPAGGGPVSSPAVSAAPVSAAMPAGSIAAPQTGTAGPGMGGGMGMMPPMMGGVGGRPGEKERDGKDRRAVLRPVPNTEPVFGELEQQRRPRRRTPREQEEQ